MVGRINDDNWVGASSAPIEIEHMHDSARALLSGRKQMLEGEMK